MIIAITYRNAARDFFVDDGTRLVVTRDGERLDVRPCDLRIGDLVAMRGRVVEIRRNEDEVRVGFE